MTWLGKAELGFTYRLATPSPTLYTNSRSPQGLPELLIGHEQSGVTVGIAGGHENWSHS